MGPKLEPHNAFVHYVFRGGGIGNLQLPFHCKSYSSFMTPCKFKSLNGKEGTVATWDAEVLAEWKTVGANSCVCKCPLEDHQQFSN